jgi:hypothetical protein
MVPVKAMNHSGIISKNGIAKEPKDVSSSVFEILIENFFDTSIHIPDCIEHEIGEFESVKKGGNTNINILVYWSKNFLNFTSYRAFVHSSFIKTQLFQEPALTVEKGYGFIFRLTPF